MNSRKWIAALLGLGVGGYVIYQLLKPKPTEERKEERTPEELRRECRIRVSQVCSQAGGVLKDKCSGNEVSIASYECVDTIYQCCLSVTQQTQREEQVVEAPSPRERTIGVAAAGATTTATTGTIGITTTQEVTPTPTPQPYQPPPEIPIEVLQPGCPPSLPDGPYDSPLPGTVTETIETINPFGRRIRATIVKKCYCYQLGPTEKPYYCCSCPQVLCPPGYYPSDVSSGDERSFLVYPGLWCNPL
jgi:hypothetical protein